MPVSENIDNFAVGKCDNNQFSRDLEVKKSYKADLEHKRPWIFMASLIGVALLFVALLFVPFRSIGDMMSEYFDDYSMDLDLKANEQDDMIAAAQPQEEVEPQAAEQLNKVDDMMELAPEQLEATPQESEADSTETKEEAPPPINQNGDDEETQRIVEQLPEYPGGMVEFMKWLTKTLKYPEDALKRKIEGKVMVSFIVNKDGTLSDVKVVKPANPLLDAEALRVVKLMPNWKPGTENGKVCRTMIAIPIVFEI